MNRGNTVLVTLVAAMVIPRIQKLTGVRLDTDDVVALMALAFAGAQGAAAIFERYFPPPTQGAK